MSKSYEVSVMVSVHVELDDDGTIEVRGMNIDDEGLSDDFYIWQPVECEWLSRGEANELEHGLDMMMTASGAVASALRGVFA